jgi:DNA-binding transcriptional ArsR family regulator
MREFLAVMKAMSDESRARALMALGRGELCVCQLIELLGLAPSTVSKHMAVLQQARLVESRKEGRWVYYRLADADAPRCAREALAWAKACLKADPTVRTDAARVRAVRRMSRDELCAHYRS